MQETPLNGRVGPRSATKRAVIALLIGLNLVLFAMLASHAYRLPSAFAQAGIRPGDFACVAAKPLGQTYDVFYVVDTTERKLHAFHPIGAQNPQLRHVAPRDLAKDFGRQTP